jgi:hypothetical protein
MHMEHLVLSALIFQALTALTVLAGAAADAVLPRSRQPRYWTAPPMPLRIFPPSVYDLQEAGEEESYPRAA